MSDREPKQVAQAMDCLAQARRLIADIRIGGDRLLETLFIAASDQQPTKSLQLILKEEEAMTQHIQNLRTIGKQLQDSGIPGNNSLHGTDVVSYAPSKHHQAAVDQTRSALKAFTDLKRKYFPHFGDDAASESDNKKQRFPKERKTLSDVLMLVEKEVPTVKISAHRRLEWLKRADHDSSKEYQGFHNQSLDKVSVLELFFPTNFRVIVSLHPAGSTDPDAVSFFSPDEVGSYVHAAGVSTHHVFKSITRHASQALQYFVGNDSETSLYTLLHWVCSYQSIFTKACGKCDRMLLMDKSSRSFLPPVCRPYRNFSAGHGQDQNTDEKQAFHIGCFLEEP